MSALSQARQDLATLLGDVITGVSAYSEYPEKVTPPFIAVGPGDPYVEFEGATFGHRRVHLAATFVTERGTNDVRANQLDDAIVAIVEAIEASDTFVVTHVDQPGQVAINNQACLGASVNAFTEIAFV